MSKTITQHGVFLDIFGRGILLTGSSGIGKSTLALSLIDRGHGLIADDTVILTYNGENQIIGSCPPLLQDFLEIQGLGILNIRTMFGNQAITTRQSLCAVVNLTAQPISSASTSSRMHEHIPQQAILGLNIPALNLTASDPKLALLVETAVRQQILQQKGYSAQMDLQQRQRALLQADIQ